MTASPRVLISYSHDSETHRARVLDLAQQLRLEGVDAWIDQFEPAPSQGWPAWMRDQIKQSQFVVLVCTPTYRRRFEGMEQPGVGRGVAWESMLLDQLRYEKQLTHETIVPVYFEGHVDEVVPTSVRGATSHALPSGFAELVKRLTRTLAKVPAPLGKRLKVPAVRSRSAERKVSARREVEERGATRANAALPPLSLVALEAAVLSQREEDPHRCLFQMLHLARMCDALTEVQVDELEGALAVVESGVSDFNYWPNGKHAFIPDTWYYPNGKHAFIPDTWYYPNGKHAFIPNTWYFPNGKHAGSEGSLMTFCLSGVDRETRPRVVSGLRTLRGHLRQLALVQLAWLTELNRA